MTGCFRGRGETVISIDGFAFANFDRSDLRKALEPMLEIHPFHSTLIEMYETYFMPLELPAQSQ